MKILKWILIIVVVLIATPLILALFVHSQYAVVREVDINKPKAQVFDYIKHIKNQNNYSVWNQKDPNSKMTYKGTDGTVGFVSAWDSDMKDVGKGEQEITKIDEGSEVKMQLRFKKPFEATDTAYFLTTATDSTKTHVKWGFTGKMPYPMNLLLLCMDMDKMLGGDLQKGLDNMKANLEK